MQENNTCDAPVIPIHSSGVQLLIGEEVFDLLADKVFLKGWDSLYSICKWGTVFQSSAFVTTWYSVFKDEYLPILVKCEEQGRLTGLLTMALQHTGTSDVGLRNAKGRIVGAGQYDAEYQTWLAEQHNGEEFIVAALRQIRTCFPRCDVHFRYIPPQAPLNWIRTDQVWRKRSVLYSARRPLMDLHSPDLSKMFRKGEYRNKLNRLKRLGEFTFEHVKEINIFSAILPELVVQYDFRQGAMFNKNQFKDNPRKADLLLAMFEQDLLHVSLLKSKGEIVAAIVAVAGKGWVHLGGINIHTPFKANYYSPGFVQFLMLGQHLAQEGYDAFDLTPGGDSYKERLATTHDHVYELVIASSLSFKMKRQLRKYIFGKLVKAGVRPMSTELALKKKVYLLKGRFRAFLDGTMLSSLQDLIKSITTPKRSLFYSVEVNGIKPDSSIELKDNNLSDLLAYDQTGSGRTRWEFLEEAMRRLERGDRSYTWSESGRLLACAWLRAPGQTAAGEARAADEEPMLESLYCHRSAFGRFDKFLCTLTYQVGREVELDKVCFLAYPGNKILCQSLSTLGRNTDKNKDDFF